MAWSAKGQPTASRAVRDGRHHHPHQNCPDLESSERDLVQAEVDRLLALRQASQPTDIPSCGSVFRNPRGDFAGRLIEAAGLKGLREGGAEISTVHANFIVNRGGATASDVMTLIERARDAVRDDSGILLETEVMILGDEGEAR